MTVDTATVSVLTMLMTVVPNERVGAGAPTVMKTVSAAQVVLSSRGKATASGSEARATRAPNDSLIRILSMVTAKDGSDDEEENGRRRSTGPHKD